MNTDKVKENIKKFIDEFRKKDFKKRHALGIRQTLDNNIDLTIAFSMLVSCAIKHLAVCGQKLINVDFEYQYFDYGHKLGIAYYVDGIKDKNASAICYIADKYEKIIEECHADINNKIYALGKIIKCKSLNKAKYWAKNYK